LVKSDEFIHLVGFETYVRESFNHSCPFMVYGLDYTVFQKC
jgi:hypothetical protein